MCSDNPEIVGSNPAPATNVIEDPGQRRSPLAGFLFVWRREVVGESANNYWGSRKF